MDDMAAFTTVLFDLDDTLFESSKSIKDILISLLKECFQYNADDETLNKYVKINSYYWELLRNGHIDFQTLKTGRFKEYLKELGISADAESFSLIFMEKFIGAVDLVDGAFELCRNLHKNGYKIYTASNGEDTIQKERIDRAGLAPYFTGHFNSDVMGCLKPSIEYFNYIRNNIKEKDPKKILMVGDLYSIDIEGAINAGISGCWFCRNASELKSGLPCITVRSLKELNGILT